MNNSISIDEAKTLKAKLAAEIARLVEEFEDTTLTTVHGACIYETRKGKPNRVELNVGMIQTEPAT